jgi:hypothetical protein
MTCLCLENPMSEAHVIFHAGPVTTITRALARPTLYKQPMSSPRLVGLRHFLNLPPPSKGRCRRAHPRGFLSFHCDVPAFSIHLALACPFVFRFLVSVFTGKSFHGFGKRGVAMGCSMSHGEHRSSRALSYSEESQDLMLAGRCQWPSSLAFL